MKSARYHVEYRCDYCQSVVMVPCYPGMASETDKSLPEGWLSVCDRLPGLSTWIERHVCSRACLRNLAALPDERRATPSPAPTEDLSDPDPPDTEMEDETSP